MDPDRIVSTLQELVAIPSEGGSAAEVAIVHDLAERCERLGLNVDLWPLELSALRAHPDYPGDEVERAEAWGLVATSRPSTTDVEMILSGHLDVVPVGDPSAWSVDPYAGTVLDTEHGREVSGRGACDMKAGVAAMLTAAEIALAAPDTPAFALHFVIGEEDGGLGAFATLQRGHTGRCCVIPEPTSLRLITGNAGALTFTIEVAGLATHASTRYAGSSAIDAYVGIHAALADLERRRNLDPEPLVAELPIPYPLSIGRIRSGDWPSSVPDQLVADGRLGLRITEDPQQARDELEAVVAETADRHPFLRDHPPRVSWSGGQFAGGHTPPGHPLIERVRATHHDVTGRTTATTGAPWGSDLRQYAAAGIPTLHYGPGDVRLAHGPDERVPVDQLVTSAQVMAALLRSPSPD